MMVLWWILLLLRVLGAGGYFFRGSPGSMMPSSAPREPPLEALQRRYAEGELTTEEYEERKKRLERDR